MSTAEPSGHPLAWPKFPFLLPVVPLMVQPYVCVSPTSDHSSLTVRPSTNLFSLIGSGALPPFTPCRLSGFGLIMPSLSWKKCRPGVFPGNPSLGAPQFPPRKIGGEFTRSLPCSPRFPHPIRSSQGFNHWLPFSEDPPIGAGGLICSFSFPRVCRPCLG